MSAPGRRERGFTLLEVVVAIALFALLMTLVYNVLGTSVRAFEAGQTRTDSSESRRVINEFLRGSLSGAFPLAVARNRDWVLLFEGGEGRLRYVTDLAGHVGIGGMHEIILELERQDEHDALMMRWRPLVFDKAGEVSGEFDSRVLLDRVNDFQLRFFGSEEEDLAPAWREAWIAGTQMPLLVELAVTDGEGRAWPALKVRPRVNSIRYQGAGAAGREQPSQAVPGSSDPGADEVREEMDAQGAERSQ